MAELPPALLNGNSHDTSATESNMDNVSSPAKRKVDSGDDDVNGENKRRKGTAPIKVEYLLPADHRQDHTTEVALQESANDDAAEALHHKDRQPASNNSNQKKREKNQGQNKARKFGSSRDEVALCSSRTRTNEFSPKDCPFGEKCRYEHNIRNYLKHKREDLTTFDNTCPVFQVKGTCPVGWKCRFVGSHSKEIEHEDGRKELVLLSEDGKDRGKTSEEETESGVANALTASERIALTKKNFPTPRSDKYLQYIASLQDEHGGGAGGRQVKVSLRNSSSPEPEDGEQKTDKQDNAANYLEPPLRASEKRRLYFGPETPVLAPLTTQGNLPFRRLCTSLGATFTYSEMAMSMPLLQGQKSEWALLKAHESEVQPPTFSSKAQPSPNIVFNYDQSRDLHFGAQIAANKPWLACKATEILTTLLPRGLRCVDLNVGCPIDLVYREGAGSALMDSHKKLENMLRGMNHVSGETPITVKIRMGTKDKSPTAHRLVERLVLGGNASNRGNTDPCGVAAITLHGRSRQQRYTRSADWEYISSTASLIKSLNAQRERDLDTIRAADARDQANTSANHEPGKVFFIGNGDIYSPTHYADHLTHASVDACMLARGALIKPWLFEEITQGQHLDKTSAERLRYIESFCRFGLEAWGSDEIGVGQTRRFLLEWLSFACRYVPLGLLEVLPPNIQDRPPRYRGRDELETLMASDNYRDWIRISEMFLGKANESFRWEPKHKSNAYDVQAEG